jgi:hypothetical protein
VAHRRRRTETDRALKRERQRSAYDDRHYVVSGTRRKAPDVWTGEQNARLIALRMEGLSYEAIARRMTSEGVRTATTAAVQGQMGRLSARGLVPNDCRCVRYWRQPTPAEIADAAEGLATGIVDLCPVCHDTFGTGIDCPDCRAERCRVNTALVPVSMRTVYGQGLTSQGGELVRLSGRIGASYGRTGMEDNAVDEWDGPAD